ncbi:MAG: transporter component [Clostridia bacterium]|jgi:riboflavin transporter FmnP|nr:transporter component [Clostridia bacterium]
MQKENKLFSTQNLIKMAMMSVVAVILMQFGAIKLPALFPSFLEIDFSEVPAIVGIIAIHPVAGVVIVIIKNLLKALLFGTTSAYVGELANLIVSLGYIIPLTLMIRKRKDIKTITIGIVLGIAGITLSGALINYFITIPMYAKLFMPLEAIIGMGSAVNPAITDKLTLVLYAITPFNILKGTIVALTSVAFVKSIQPVMRYLAHR